MEKFDGKRRSGGGGTALYITLAGAFLLIAVFVAMALFFKITDITVEGTRMYSPRELIDASGVELDDSIFFLNTSRAQIAIKDALPYVDTVKITRRLPGTVVITVTESVGAACFAFEGSWWVTDLSGRILERASAAPAGLVELRGVAPVSPAVGKTLDLGAETVRLRALMDTLAALDRHGRIGLTTWLDVTNLSAVTFSYNGYKVNIGDAQDLDGRFDILDNVFAQFSEPGRGQSVVYRKEDNSFRVEG